MLSAGLHASKLARMYPWTGNWRPPETYYAKGQYYAYSGKSPFGRHIYPMPDGAWLGYDARPAAVKTALAYTLKRLGVDAIDIYRPARLDPNVPIEETIGAIADMVKDGTYRKIASKYFDFDVYGS